MVADVRTAALGASVMTPEERAVIGAAIASHRGGCAPETCGGTSYDPCRLANAIEALERAQCDDSDLIWVPRTMTDVRSGDTIRLPASDATAEVLSAVSLDWNVRSGGNGPKAHFDDVPLRHGRVYLRLVYAGMEKRWDFAPDLPVEVRLTRLELQAIEHWPRGWVDRVGQLTSGLVALD